MALKSQNEWNKKNTTMVAIKLNHNTDSDIIEQLEKQPSKMGYIKQLIRDDIQKHKAE